MKTRLIFVHLERIVRTARATTQVVLGLTRRILDLPQVLKPIFFACLFAFLGALVQSTQAFSADSVGWPNLKKLNSPNYRYFVGHSGLNKTEKKAFLEAIFNATEVAKVQVFQIEEELPLLGLNPELHGFEWLDAQKRVLRSGEVLVDLLFRYPLKQIAQEKKRLRVLKSSTPLRDNNQQLHDQQIQIRSVPEGAAAFLNGHFVGLTPLENLSVPSHTPLLVELSHPNLVSISKTVYADENGKKDAGEFHMNLKKAAVLVTTIPEGARVMVDGKAFGETPTVFIPLEPVGHRLSIMKAGYETEILNIDLQPEDRTEIGPITLISGQERNEYLLASKRLLILSMLGSRRAKVRGDQIYLNSQGLSFEYRYKEQVAFRLGGFFEFGGSEVSGRQIKVYSEALRFGVPYFPFDFRQKFLKQIYLEPEVLASSSQFSINSSSDSNIRFGIGFSLGYRFFIHSDREKGLIWGVGSKLGLQQYYESIGSSPDSLTFAISLADVFVSF